jgi:tetratricopeptide (TPR) repeat protein
MESLRQQIQTLLTTSSMLIRSGKFEQAIERIQAAGKLLAGVENQDASRLRKTCARLQLKFEERRAQQAALNSRTEVLLLLGRADLAIFTGRFSEGIKILEEAVKRWPAKLFPERSAQIEAKLVQARRIEADGQTELGRSRQALLRMMAQLEGDSLSGEQVARMRPWIERLDGQGTKDESLPYADVELLGQVKLRLDRAATTAVAQIKRLRGAYQDSEDSDERERLYDRSKHLQAIREQIEELLGLLTGVK